MTIRSFSTKEQGRSLLRQETRSKFQLVVVPISVIWSVDMKESSRVAIPDDRRWGLWRAPFVRYGALVWSTNLEPARRDNGAVEIRFHAEFVENIS